MKGTKTKKLMTGVLSTVVATSMTGCGNQQSLPPEPDDPNCDEWEWEAEDGVYECEDFDSDYNGYLFYAGAYYMTKSKLKKSSAYKKYRSSKSFKGGFGSGSKGGFGG
ncbi:hypothetical protein [Pseudalkalibacillus berkeleyi]|uniref:Aminotransferase yhxA n=1 Tax=Pseudalkalibacillus berkeleyi TaxID=1069813 RepID=A0ABS9H082_9BACL|nr:hypothetical protein [Pseudalkalibacillus berkeleyi]MCF6137331.1 hypothetical protein [Pseudalkalibacillus berkeleyi]